MKLIVAILSGGSGSRLWPISREMEPKPFIKLADGESFLQKSLSRASQLPHVSEVLTVTNREFFFKTKDEYQAVKNKQTIATSYILEPMARNTAAAVAMATLYAATQYGEDANVLILTADHLIQDQTAFANAVQQASDIGEQGYIVTFGIKPNAPETGYGYIEADTQQALLTGYRVARFVEKPNTSTAQQYIDSGKFYWNSGMFCFKANVMLTELAAHASDILEACKTCYQSSILQTLTQVNGEKIQQLELNSDSFAQVPSNSIDYAIMEKSSKVAVVPCNIGWTDVGAWDAMSALTPASAENNRIQGNAIVVNSQDCYVHESDRLIALVGLKNTLVVDTPDALLIADSSQAQKVKDIYYQLKQQGDERYKLHKTVHRPWGTYTILKEGPRFKIKSIIVKPGKSLSLQMHHHRSEHWVVVSGTATVVNDNKQYFVLVDESTYIPTGTKHRLENQGKIDLEIIEVQSGDYVGEDDIIRFS